MREHTDRGKGPVIDFETRAEVTRLDRLGLDRLEIARRLGVGASTVHRVVARGHAASDADVLLQIEYLCPTLTAEEIESLACLVSTVPSRATRKIGRLLV